jgi:hypothetical protein
MAGPMRGTGFARYGTSRAVVSGGQYNARQSFRMPDHARAA